MPSNTTDRNQNTRQTAQDEASAVRGLAKHNQDYRRLPKALQAIVDAFSDVDNADEHMAEAQVAASHPDMARQDPNDDMLHELAGLVAHVRAELRRHGVIEGALAWLASHPEGWDDAPEDTTPAEPIASRPVHGIPAWATLPIPERCDGASCGHRFGPGDLVEEWQDVAGQVIHLCYVCAGIRGLKPGAYHMHGGYTLPTDWERN